MNEAYICDGVRTPFGRYGGALSTIRADDLAALPLKALIARYPTLDWSALDDVILGCANQAGEDNRNVARMAALLSDLPSTTPGVTVNRLCASGLEAIAQAARAIRAGDAQLMIAGGVEHMTRAPFVMGKTERAFARDLALQDTTMGWRFVNPEMERRYGVDSMPQTAENVARQFAVSREDQDAFALRSQQRFAKAADRGVFDQEIHPVTLPARRGDPVIFQRDEHPRPDTDLAALARLRPVVTDDGTITAGNASGINDGACALVIASPEAMRIHGLSPLARIIACSAAGVEPRIMGMGPVAATTRLLTCHGLAIGDLDIIELNEAFAAQALACLRELGMADDANNVNPNGGAIAIGHPLGASGARLALTAAYQLQRTGGRYALCTMCIGVGQGVAMLLERA
ncbi:MAG: 3-oxoadipyl-CoA thiolase [Gammaproteobacteria bacterium]|nr:3-oxoadipyl-CoA thiolase [Gammaproteobacteria bacterium]